MDFWHVTNQGEGKIEKENSQPTLALDLHFTISRLPEKNLRWFWKPLLLIFQRTRCCVQIAKCLFWRGKWNLCGWRSSKLLKIARVTGGLAAQLGRNRRHWRWTEKAVACSNIFPSTDLPSAAFIRIFHPEEIQNRVPHRSHPPTQRRPPFLILPGDRACQGDLCLLAATHPQNCCHSLPHGRTL